MNKSIETLNEGVSSTHTSVAQAIYVLTRYTDKRHLTLIDIMGLTTHAFRIRVSEKVGIIGPLAHVWGSFYRRAISNLGLKAICYDPIVSPSPPEHIEQALRLIQDSLDRGIPAIVWDLPSRGEFGVVYGYDDDQKLLYARDRLHDDTVSYEKIGQGHITTITIEDSFEKPYIESVRDALGMILVHAKHYEDGLQEYRNGLAGYDAWIQSFEKGAVDPLGGAYNALIVYDARRFAAQFLLNLQTKFRLGELNEPKRHNGIHSEFDFTYMADCCGWAHERYTAVADAFGELHQMFPFPQGGQPNDPKQSARAIDLLKQARNDEDQGLNFLAKIFYDL